MIHILQFSVKLSVLNQANVKETLLGLTQSVNVLKVIFIQVNVFLKPTQPMRIRLGCLRIKNHFVILSSEQRGLILIERNAIWRILAKSRQKFLEES